MAGVSKHGEIVAGFTEQIDELGVVLKYYQKKHSWECSITMWQTMR